MIYLVRHGETDWNLFKRCNGITDTYLNRTGIKQANLQAEKLGGVSFDACYCSPQTRAREFCKIINKGTISFDDRLAEINCGAFEGMEETAEMMKSFWNAIKTGDRGTESFAAFVKRNCDLCDKIVTEHRAQNVLIVTHAANTRVIDHYFRGKPNSYDFRKSVVNMGGYVTYEN